MPEIQTWFKVRVFLTTGEVPEIWVQDPKVAEHAADRLSSGENTQIEGLVVSRVPGQPMIMARRLYVNGDDVSAVEITEETKLVFSAGVVQ
jgi:hypothetical protein